MIKYPGKSQRKIFVGSQFVGTVYHGGEIREVGTSQSGERE